MKILITGGAGFIASHIVDAYINLGHQVVIVDNLSTGKKEFLNNRAKFYQVDILHKDKILKVIKKEKPQVINHHAAQISVRDSVVDPINDAKINIVGLLNLLEAGRLNSTKKIIFASSGGVVYGEAKIIPTPETYLPLLPMSPYGITKLAGEYYLNYYYQTYGINYLALRYSNVYGPRQNPHGEAGVVAIFSKKMLNKEQPIINGDGRQTRDYVFVKDVVEANIKALQSTVCGSFNIGTGIETDVLEIFTEIKKIIGIDIKEIHGPAKKGEQQRSCLDVSFVRDKLKWQVKTNMAEGLQHTVAFFRRYEKKP